MPEGQSPTVKSIERLVSLQVACELVPFPTMAALYMFLYKHPEIKRVYRRSGGPKMHRRGFEQAFLTETQILQIREMTFHDKSQSRFANAGRPPGRRNSHSLVKFAYGRLG